MNKIFGLLFTVLCISLNLSNVLGQAVTANGTHGSLKFEENKKQWSPKVLFKTDLKGGRLFLEKDKFTFVYYNLSDIEKAHDKSSKIIDNTETKINCHAYEMKFLGANNNVVVSGSDKMDGYNNYFIGNDSSHWASNVSLYHTVVYSNVYRGIDINVYSQDVYPKYDFVIYPEGDIKSIKIKYSGTDRLFVKDGNLIIHTSISDITEYKPIAFQIINGEKKKIDCNYLLQGDSVSYEITENYNKNIPLIIDPVIVASTFSGTPEDTWGHCAAYDDAGNIYTGGRNFGTGYPVTLGAFQTYFAGGVDIAISKYNPTGSNLIFGTYIGGFNEDIAQSMFVDSNNELCIYGSTNSSNYPITSGCFDNTFNGSTDILITKLNASGNALIGSTYVGGSNTDGQNALVFNYGDEFRGEIFVDINNNIYISSFTSSLDFPTTTGAYDQSYNGGQDAVVFKLNSNLTSMLWSTYLGGSGSDAGYSLRVDNNGSVYVVGGTNSSNFPTTSGVLHSSYMGGTSTGYVNVAADGFISQLSATGNAMTASTYFGTSSFDEVFFVDLDANNNVYVFGYTQGSIAPTSGVYANPGSSQFITKLSPALDAVIYSTLFGSGSITTTQQYNFAENYSFSPTAFMVDICEQVYVAGWGNVSGFPYSTNAFQTYADLSSFYLMVLKKDVNQLLYATFYGDNSGTWDHVDGGTSRFDKKGIVYEAVCGCGSSFPTLPNAYSQYNNSWNCDIAVFKIDFQSVGTQAIASAAPADTGCAPYTVNFINNSQNAVDYLWDFGDGSPQSSVNAPSHTYSVPGTYHVVLIASSPSTCNTADTTELTILVINQAVVNLGNDTVLCSTANLILDAGNPGFSYLWSTGEVTQTITATNTGSYWVEVNNGFCSATDTINITIQPLSVSLGNDTILCDIPSITLMAGNSGCNYLWSTGATTQSILVSQGGVFWVDINNGNCFASDTIEVNFVSTPTVFLGNDTLLCPGDVLVLNAGNPGLTYLWSTGANTQNITVTAPGLYWVSVSIQNCGNSDNITVSYVLPPNLGEDVNLCNKTQALLNAGSDGGNYLWSTGATTQSIVVTQPGLYWVTIIKNNCLTTDTIAVNAGGSFTMYFPNTFTPDEDGLNDVFSGYGEGVEIFDMMIFNRWGELIFKTDDYLKGWDGKYKGLPVQSDVYVYVATFKTNCTEGGLQKKIGRAFLLH